VSAYNAREHKLALGCSERAPSRRSA